MRNKEVDLLVAIQDALYTPETARAARGLSYFGEHDLGWLAVAGVGGAVDKQNRSKWLALGAGTFAAHAVVDVIHRPGGLPDGIAPRWYSLGCAVFDVYIGAVAYWPILRR